ncbi:hypothetical protein TPHA_0J03180 [Tetrapisispora phaffii CBS 4417]|uniref:Protein kinase domain-containing protein n=1 Tax=Tetrapisispora phaffii (strain ATCC 24235 / CBS 4417 / NBRC 1672 / NRRL Y-8282 / UCD 70-5) TaxID=1071381 RepID=G8BY86_TETPH|nr:hypothetical protein TPHA_0J03180 [Tetrapisispora phaffii CBS 4417]CCE65137.1 hypothetical protein TPHA_0J03180 [Tetrapisispora phaffii CBS 4417]
MTEYSTTFNDIESEKENILPLKQGRSALHLSQMLRQDMSQLNSTKIIFEKRLMEELEEMDDPLELYLEYIQWINDAFPQGGTSKQSGMLDLMERCLMYLKDVDIYKNDPRYLKIWLWYIDLFARGSLVDMKDIFVYMYRKRIGVKLTLFYEEFVNILMNMKRFKEAMFILENGLEENARPLKRLQKKYDEFSERVRELNIDLTFDKLNCKHMELPDLLKNFEPPKMVLGKERDEFIETFQESNNVEKLQNNKIQIFQDDANDSNNILIDKNDGWDMLNPKNVREKENRLQSTMLESGINAGKLKQSIDSIEDAPIINSNHKHVGKISIFQDKIGRTDPVYKIIEIPGKKTEKIDVNFNLIYPGDNEEYCFEELMAISRNVFEIRPQKHLIMKDSPQNKKIKTNIEQPFTEKDIDNSPEIPSIINQIGNLQSSNSNSAITSAPNSQEQVENVNFTKTSILPLNDTGNRITPKKENTLGIMTANKLNNSPTITFFSKNAINEVYSMFNQNYEGPNSLGDNDEHTENKFALYENTQEFTKQNLDDLTEVKNVAKNNLNSQKSVEEDTETLQQQMKLPEQKIETRQEYRTSNTNNMMTPIKENKESFYSTSQSSPFLTQPNHYRNKNLIINPLSIELRTQLLSKLTLPLKSYQTFYDYKQPLKMSAFLKNIHRLSISENKNPIVDFKKTGDLYCIRGKLGEGGYATVYLAESSTGRLNALKVEKPASKWEYYILKQIEKRLKGDSILRSIIQVNSLHCFTDESYLVLKYADQGTLLDLINHYKNKVNQSKDIGINEILCMFFTVELIKVITKLHSIDIIHGDIKPDNCMIRFEKSEISMGYKADGSHGWNFKGLYLIDFGRSFDMQILPEGTKFIADWNFDDQDCLEVQQKKEWSYEIDYFGLANMIHYMLFGEPISLNTNNHGKLNKNFKRYWQKDNIWLPLFEVLINYNKVYSNFEIERKLIEIQKDIEEFLISNSINNNRFRNEIFELENELHSINIKI